MLFSLQVDVLAMAIVTPVTALLKLVLLISPTLLSMPCFFACLQCAAGTFR
jgi:hypothetical protein